MPRYHLLLLAVLALGGCARAEVVLHVAPGGDDAADGSAARPLATLAGARDHLRADRPTGPVTVWFAAGTYPIGQPVAFAKEDSGTPDAPITYRAAEGAEVRLTGGRPVTGWTTSTFATGRVQVADLKAQGITDYGQLGVRGFAKGSPLAEVELFWNDRPMTLARWPNEGFRGASAKIDDQHIQVDTDRVARWVDESEPWVFAYWFHDWAELYEPLAGVEPERNVVVRSAEIKPQYGIDPKRTRWYAFNLLSELDQPGEYYLDRTTGKLYFWPPEPGGTTVVSQAEGILRGDELSHVTFRGFTIEACRGTAVQLSGGTDCHLVGCTIRNVAGRGVVVNGGTKHEVYGCDVYDCGEGGISMGGGDRATLAPAGHNAENNHVYRYSRRARTYKCAVAVYGVGNRIAHNLVHDGPHMALAAGGNDHLVEYNEIHNVVYESGDAGAYYVGRDWTQRGTILRGNYFHHVVGGTGYGGMTIYLDDQFCGTTIEGNLFERCSQAVFIGGGCDNQVLNNVFLGCWKAAHLDNRGMGWQKKATDDPKGELRTRLAAMPYQNELWRGRYPNLPGILDDDPGVPKRNVFRGNLSAGGLWDDINRATRQYQTVEDNLVHDDDPDWIKLVKDADGRPLRLELKEPDAVAAIGFEPLALEQMGVYQDERRASWPVEHEVRPVTLPEAPKPRLQADLPPNLTWPARRIATAPTFDGDVGPDEWTAVAGNAVSLGVDYQGGVVEPPAQAWLCHDGTSLWVGITTPLGAKRQLGHQWGSNEAVELAFRGEGEQAQTLVLRGYTDGTFESVTDAGAGADAAAKLEAATEYHAKVAGDHWSAEWKVGLSALGLAPGGKVHANVTVRRTDGNLWIMARPTHGNSWLAERVGTLALAP